MIRKSGLNRLKDEIILAAGRAYKRGIQTGSGGNFSARVPGEALMVVKSSGGSFADADRRNLLVTDFDGNVVLGKGRPTREALLHGFIYNIAPDTGGIMHCHSPWSVGWAATGKPLDKVTLHTRLKFGCPIEVLDIKTPVVEKKDFVQIERLFEKNPNLPAFILADHGIVALGSGIINAEHNAQLVEETAMIAVIKSLLGA